MMITLEYNFREPRTRTFYGYEAGDAFYEALIEAHISAQQFHTMGLREGETLVVTPRRAKVFLDEAAGI